jgi:hypothetical protein
MLITRHQFVRYPWQACYDSTQGHATRSSSPWRTLLSISTSLRHWWDILISFLGLLVGFSKVAFTGSFALGDYCLYNVARTKLVHKGISCHRTAYFDIFICGADAADSLAPHAPEITIQI